MQETPSMNLISIEKPVHIISINVSVCVLCYALLRLTFHGRKKTTVQMFLLANKNENKER